MGSGKGVFVAVALLSVVVIVFGFSSCGENVADEKATPGYTRG
jgi:hypothetical protein